jgi:biopolymer transport protein ExbD
VRARRGRWLQEPAGTFPVIPMIDVILNLLIFFLLISRYLPDALSVDLPRADSGSPTDRSEILIAIDANGDVQLNGEAQAWDDLSGRLAQWDVDTVVHIAADSATRYDFVVRALDAAGSAGLPHIALETVTDRTDDQPAGGA